MLGIICYILIKAMKTRILLVDDEPDLLEILADTLEGEGFETVLAPSAKEFCDKALACKPDLIILDIDLGGHNGPEIYDLLLRKGLDSRIPVIFLSGLIEVTDRVIPEGRRYMLHAKPFDPVKLVSDVRRLTKNPRFEAA